MKSENVLGLMAIILLAVILLAIPFTDSYASPKKDQYELSMNIIVPAGHSRWKYVTKPWTEKIVAKTGGRVKFTPYFSGGLSPLKENYESVVKGIADVAVCFTSATEYFPLIELAALPTPSLPTALGNSRMAWHIYNTIPEVKAEFKDVKVLGLGVCPTYNLYYAADKPIDKLEDLKGLKIKFGSWPGIDRLGFTSVYIYMSDLYSALDKGVVDGCALPTDAVRGRKLYEVLDYCTYIELGAGIFYYIMNVNTWNKLPPDIQAVFNEYGGSWLVDFFGKKMDEINEKDTQILKDNGIEYINLSADEKDRWIERLKGLGEELAAKLDAKGKPGTTTLNEVKKFCESYK